MRISGATEDGRVIGLYTKNGGVGLYGSLLILVPDYDVALTILVAGDVSSMEPLAETTLTMFLPVIDRIGKIQAASQFAGRYGSSEGGNSSMTLSLDEGPGLNVDQLLSRGKDILAEYHDLLGSRRNDTMVSLRLYPTGLRAQNSNQTHAQDLGF